MIANREVKNHRTGKGLVAQHLSEPGGCEADQTMEWGLSLSAHCN